MPERENTVDFNVHIPVSLYQGLEQLRGMLGEPLDSFYADILERGGAVKGLDQVYDQVVSVVDDEGQELVTLFEYMDIQTSGGVLPFQPKLLPFDPNKGK